LLELHQRKEMQAVPRNTANHLATAFAGEKKGFAAKEITNYFTRYSTMVKPYDHYGINPTRHELFIESLYLLQPKEQYYSLTDLCLNPPPMKYAVPSEEERKQLLGLLHSFLNPNPIGLAFSQLREHVFRQDWYTAYSRLTMSPAAAITAGRALLETAFKTIVSERKQTPDNSGSLSALLKQTEDVLGFKRPQRQEEHSILTGLTSVINGIASISNASGDRHGLIDGVEIDDPSMAELVVNACGAVGLLFIELHLFKPAS
jgi:hypothetical protein